LRFAEKYEQHAPSFSLSFSKHAPPHNTLLLAHIPPRSFPPRTHTKTELATFLHTKFQTELLSTGGTAAAIRNAGIPCKDVSDYTGSPEILDGRVKTLHPKIHGGEWARVSEAEESRRYRH
jgi:hypothetical protein